MSVENERRTNTEHKVTVTVELADGTVISQEQGFNSGNPLFHANEMIGAASWCLKWATKMMAGRYGDIRKIEAEALQAIAEDQADGVWTMTDAKFKRELAQAKAEALREAANESRVGPVPYGWNASGVASWLRARAATIESEA